MPGTKAVSSVPGTWVMAVARTSAVADNGGMSERPVVPRQDLEAAVEARKELGRAYDPEIVDAFEDSEPELRSIRRELAAA